MLRAGSGQVAAGGLVAAGGNMGRQKNYELHKNVKRRLQIGGRDMTNLERFTASSTTESSGTGSCLNPQ